MSTNVATKALTFPDQSTYYGQVLEGHTLVPHGYGVLTSHDGFEMAGFFLNGKACGPGCFTSPEGERFYGQWNALHKRDGPFLALRPNASAASNQSPSGDTAAPTSVPRLLVEHYAGGTLVRRLKPAAARAGVIAWALEAPVEYGSPVRAAQGSDEGAGGEVEAPCPRTGHAAAVLGLANSGIHSSGATANADKQEGRTLAVFGGSTCTTSGAILDLADFWLLDVPTVTWYPGPLTGCAPPGLRGATLTAAPAAGGGELLVLLGGQTGIGGNVTVYVYDSRVGVWGVAPWQSPAGLMGHTATALSADALPSLAGAGASATPAIAERGRAAAGAPAAAAAAAAASAAFPAAAGAGAGIVVVCAGRVWSLYTSTWQWAELPQLWPPRVRAARAFTHHAAAAGADGRVWVHGGQLPSGGANGWGAGEQGGNEGKEYVRCTAELKAYDPQTGEWEILPAPPTSTGRKGNLPPLPSSPASTTTTAASTRTGADARAAALAAAAGAKAAAAGGRAAFSGLELGFCSLPRSLHTLTADEAGTRLYVIGGWTMAHPQMNVIDTNYLADVHVYDLTTKQWETPLLRFPICPPRGAHTALTARPGEIWVLGGSNDGSPEAGLWDLCVLTTGKCASETPAAVQPSASARAPVPSASAAATTNAVATRKDTLAKKTATATAAVLAAPIGTQGAGTDRAALLLAAAERRRAAAAAATTAPAGSDEVAVDETGSEVDDGPLEVGNGSILAAFTKSIR